MLQSCHGRRLCEKIDQGVYVDLPEKKCIENHIFQFMKYLG